MKPVISNNRILVSLTTLLVLLSSMCILSSCRDQDFDFDEAHAQTQYEKFSNVFIKSFGKPQEGHQWGFDKANLAMDGAMSTRAVIKQEEKGKYDEALYGKPNDIYLDEHNEVAAWFRNHRLTWKDNPTLFEGDPTKEVVCDMAYVIDASNPGYGSLATASYGNTLGDYSIQSNLLNFNNAWIQKVSQRREASVVYRTLDERNGKAFYSGNGKYYVFDGLYAECDENGNVSERLILEDHADTAGKLKVYNGTKNLIHHGGGSYEIGKSSIDRSNNIYKINNSNALHNFNDLAQVYYDDLSIKKDYLYKLEYKVYSTQTLIGNKDMLYWRFVNEMAVGATSVGTFTGFKETNGWETKTETIKATDNASMLTFSFGCATPAATVGYFGLDEVYLYELPELVPGSNLVFYKVINGNLMLYKDKTTGKIYKAYSGNYKQVTNMGTPQQNPDLIPVNDGSVPSSLSLEKTTYAAGSQGGTSNKMNYIQVWDIIENKYNEHTNDFNASGCYGWGRQPSTDNTTYQDSPSSNQNAILVTNANVNEFTYQSSEGSSSNHDKYLIVHLKGQTTQAFGGVPAGTPYEGWYLGFDFESWGNQNNEKLLADGICDDLILKLTPAHNAAYTNLRIMVEDLGGETGTTNKSDIDYNDIVLDVTATTEGTGSNAKSVVYLTMQAAGGTLPLIVNYNGTDLFETHALFENDWAMYNDNRYDKAAVDYSIMYRTGHESDLGGRSAKTFKLYVGTDVPDAETKAMRVSTFDMNQLSIKVYRFTADKYVKSTGAADPVEWITHTVNSNVSSGAPVMFCVPQKDSNGQEVKWMKERKAIDTGYPEFSSWVADSSVEFWNNKGSELY